MLNRHIGPCADAGLWVAMGTWMQSCYIPSHLVYSSLGPDQSKALTSFYTFPGCDTTFCLGERINRPEYKLTMPHNQWQPTGTLSTATHRCRNNEIYNITYSLMKLCQIYLYRWTYWPSQSSRSALINSSGLKYVAKRVPNFPQNTIVWAWESAVARECQRFIFNPNHSISNLVCWGGQCGDRFIKGVCGLSQGWYTTRGKSVK